MSSDGSVTSNVVSSYFRVWLEDLIDSHTFFASFEAGMLHNRFLRAFVTSILFCYVLWDDFRRTRVDRRTFFCVVGGWNASLNLILRVVFIT